MNAKPSAMWRDEPEPPPPPYSGPWIKFDGDGVIYTAWIDPALPTGEGLPRQFGARHEGWSQVLEWARSHRLPVRDLTNMNASKRVDK